MSPAEQLEGLTLANGWTVESVAPRSPNATGGYFSHGYITVNSEGKKGFLKALDYTAAFYDRDTAGTLQAMTNAYIFEKKLCEKCAHLSRIARAIDDGSILITPAQPFTKVEYLIFELANGDIRAHLDLQAGLDVVFVMQTLHNIATGLKQLHKAEIAHQDLKPSNVLVFSKIEGAKICDLGRAWDRNMPAPHDTYDVAGQRSYAPIELMYGDISSDFRARRFGCDLYHLGSLIVFLFARVNITSLVMDNLAEMHRPNKWGGSYSEVLPFIQAAFDIALQKFALHVPPFIRDKLQRIVSELCNPDSSRRGHPQNRGTTQFSLIRYISQFDRLIHDAELELMKVR
jgi:serine/threonine protein kinase